MAMMLQLLKSAWLPIMKWGGLFIGALFFIFKIRQSGKDAIIQENIKETLNSVQEHEKIQNNLNRASDSKLDKLLQNYTRD